MCYLCENDCPTNAFNATTGQVSKEFCIMCMYCVTSCPDQAITIGDATELYKKFSTTHNLTKENVNRKRSKIIY